MKKNIILTLFVLNTLSIQCDMNLEENIYAPAREMIKMDDAMNKAIEEKHKENKNNPIIFKDDVLFQETPIADFIESNNSYVLEQTVEDANNSKVDVTLKNSMLTISIVTTTEDTIKTTNSTQSSSYTSTTTQTMTLPSDADIASIKHSLQNGVLKIIVSKKRK